MTDSDVIGKNLNEIRLIIVEDEPMLAYALEECLLDAGFQIAGVAGRLAGALALIETGNCDAAVIDANLAGVSAAPAAAALVARGVPFIVVSGYSREQQQGAFPEAQFLQKPYQPDELVRAVRSLFGPDRRP
jgi:DNA-binding response OmpR family regulator